VIADKMVDMNSHSDDVIDMAAFIMQETLGINLSPFSVVSSGSYCSYTVSSLKRFLHNLLDCKGKYSIPPVN